jgi:hypothetical protein
MDKKRKWENGYRMSVCGRSSILQESHQQYAEVEDSDRKMETRIVECHREIISTYELIIYLWVIDRFCERLGVRFP